MKVSSVTFRPIAHARFARFSKLSDFHDHRFSEQEFEKKKKFFFGSSETSIQFSELFEHFLTLSLPNHFNPYTVDFFFDNWLISARSDKPLFIQHCHACLQASVAVLYEQRFVACGQK